MNDVNTVVRSIEHIFISASETTYGFQRINTGPNISRTNKPTHKKWFNQECRNARNTYHHVRKQYNKYKTTYFKNRLKTVSKQYKGAISKNMNIFKNERINKLRNLKDAKPRDFWKIINSVDKKESSTAPLHELYDYFKTLNEDGYNDDSDLHTNFSQSNVNNTNSNNALNMPFTESEIIRAVKNLKNNKSNGIDNILNEHLKMSIHTMLPIYKKLFNIIFDTGIVPESWLIGDILPIYKNKGDPNLPENYRPITLLSCLVNFSLLS